MWAEIGELLGKTLSEIERGNDELIFRTKDGHAYRLFHQQDCCETVTIEDINGELSDLIGSPVLMAEGVSNSDDAPKTSEYGYTPESYTWTFYKFATIKGTVVIRWYGESNGYYSETADFEKIC